MNKIRNGAVLSLLAVAAGAQAQESNFSVVLGVKAWNTQWTTWFYDESKLDDYEVIVQAPAKNKVIAIPQLSMRWHDFIASVSGTADTDYTFSLSGTPVKLSRKELDANIGYYVLPGLATSLGYKKFTQSLDGASAYEVHGPTLGVSATTQLVGSMSAYGALALGRMKNTDSKSKVDADYHLTEVGLAYTFATGRFLKAVSLTGGYRMQVITAKDVLLVDTVGNRPSYRQDARDVTQGFTIGLVAAF